MAERGRKLLVGVISGTHGLIRPQALAGLRGADLIIHGGDVGNAEILNPLREIAPTFAVRGNVHITGARAQLPATATIEVGELLFYVLHDIAELRLDPAAVGFAAVVYGHSHRCSIEIVNLEAACT